MLADRWLTTGGSIQIYSRCEKGSPDSGQLINWKLNERRQGANQTWFLSKVKMEQIALLSSLSRPILFLTAFRHYQIQIPGENRNRGTFSHNCCLADTRVSIVSKYGWAPCSRLWFGRPEVCLRCFFFFDRYLWAFCRHGVNTRGCSTT